MMGGNNFMNMGDMGDMMGGAPDDLDEDDVPENKDGESNTKDDKKLDDLDKPAEN